MCGVKSQGMRPVRSGRIGSCCRTSAVREGISVMKVESADRSLKFQIGSSPRGEGCWNSPRGGVDLNMGLLLPVGYKVMFQKEQYMLLRQH